MDRTPPDLPLALGVTGASGAPYWVRLLEVVLAAGHDVHLCVSDNVDTVCRAELGQGFDEALASAMAHATAAVEAAGEVRIYDRHDFHAPMASGSARLAGLVLVPCSMGTLGRIANGTSDDLLSRAADVCLKERRPLILVPRETPLGLIHLENMARVTRAGAVVLPAMPGFYHRPQSIADLVDFVVQRIADQLGIAVDLAPRWGDRE